jgi:S-DNA-T family DNA segregation ATPase FtsK/SpoIIIE
VPVQEPTGPETETVMGAMLSRIEGRGPAAYQIWLPPLADPLTLDGMLPQLRDTETRGFCPEGWPANGRLTVPVAMVDKPFEQKRDLLWADLSGSAGHAVVIGAPQSGKSTLLRTLVGALALTHTPAEVQFFFLDFGGGGLSGLAGLPHVSGAAGRLDADRCRRIVAEVTTLLADRERLFTERGIDSMAAFRAQPPPTADGRRFGDVFLFIDGWMTLKQEFEALEEAISTLAARGLGYGIHLVISANRWMELRPAIRDMIGTQFELRLGDPSDSAIDRRAAATVPESAPGRGLTRDKLQFLTSLPRVDGRPGNGDLASGVTDLVKRVDAGWRGPRAPQVRLLPGLIELDALPAPVPGNRKVPLGISEADLGPVFIDFDIDPHFVAFGDTESGKTALLRLIGHGIMRRYTPERAGIVVADYRRSLLGAIEGPHLIEYCGSVGALGGVMGQVEEALRTRLPGPSVTAEQLRNRSWWKGPELFVLVDDYDLVATQGGNPLSVLADFLPQARDIGLHLVVVRRSGGAGRAMYEPILQRLRDLATPGIILSGSKDEGALLGDVKPSVQPPGRGQLVSRRSGVALVQVAWAPDSTVDAPPG